MLSELLPAGRWKLLKALWLDGATDSIHALARQNRMSYSSAHAELTRLERAGLAQSTVVGNSRVFEAKKEHPAALAVEALVRASVETAPDRADGISTPQLMAHLAALGAPLRTDATATGDLAPEEVVAQGLRLTRSHPTLARAYPVLLARNRNRLNMESLRQRAMALNEKQTLGFFLELTGELANDQRLCSFAQTLRDRRIRKVQNFFEGPLGKYSERLADERTPPVASKWHFRMNMDMDNFRQFYAKFCQA